MSCTMYLTCTTRCRPSSAPWLPLASCSRPWRGGPMPWPSSAGIALTYLASRFLSIPPKTVRPPWPGWEQPTIRRMSITSWFSQMLKIIACVWVGSCWEMIFTPSRGRRCCSASTHTRMPDRSPCTSCTTTSLCGVAGRGGSGRRKSTRSSPSWTKDCRDQRSPIMRRTLIRNADLVMTMEPRFGDGDLGILPGGDVLIEDDRIAAVGQGLDGAGARIVDATGKIVLPGFVDVHNHLWQALIRGCGTSLAVGEWLQACVFPVGQLNVTAEEAYAVVRLSTLDVLSTGVTTVVDWSHAFNPDFVRGNVQALLDSGLRFAFAYRGRVECVEDMQALKCDMIDPNPRARLQIGGVNPMMATEVRHT